MRRLGAFVGRQRQPDLGLNRGDSAPLRSRPGVDEPVVWYEGAGVGAGSRRYLHTDHQGSRVAIADAAGSIEGGGCGA